MNCLVCDNLLDFSEITLQICKKCKEEEGIEWNYPQVTVKTT
jgi:hypothetical protein